MKLFDLHCDTILDVHNHNLSLTKNDLHIDLEKLSVYEASVQVAAIWAEKRRSDESAWEHFLAVSDTFYKQTAQGESIAHVTTTEEIRRAVAEKKHAFLLAVEDARILNGDLSRVDILRARGVRFLTLTWGGETCIGGSHDTELPLTAFGRAVVRRCFDVGIIPDISHASRAVTAEVLEIAREVGNPVVATHSNAYSVYPHTRNLTDEEFQAITALGGIVGISMVPYHLTDHDNGAPCTLETLAAHIRHFFAHGGTDTLCMGSDFDGIDVLPSGIDNISSLPRLAEHLRTAGISQDRIDHLFFDNAYNFAMRNL